MKRILVADDEEFIRRLFQKVLSDAQLAALGSELHFATNGQEVLDLAGRVPFHLITMDISMPVLSGVEATRQIRADPARYGNPKIIAVTGVGEKKEAIEAGCDDYLSKPVTNQELLETVLFYLAPDRTRRAAPEPEGTRILLIGTEHTSLYWSQKALRKAGYVPMLAEGFADALRLCRFAQVPNLVLVEDSLLASAASADGRRLVAELQAGGVPVLLRGAEQAREALSSAWADLVRGVIPGGASEEEVLALVGQALG